MHHILASVNSRGIQETTRKLNALLEEKESSVIYSAGMKAPILKKVLPPDHQPDNDPELVARLEEVSPGILAFGHYHYTSIRSWHNLKLVNVAPCNYAPVDGDHRARYTIFSSEAGRLYDVMLISA